jgi:hypothetical protein
MQLSPTNHAAAALKRLVVARVITSFTTNFDRRREAGFRPQVEVTTRAYDELSIARVRRRVEQELAPLLGHVTISVLSERTAKGWPVGTNGARP